MSGRIWVDCALEIKSANDDGRIEGHGAVFGNIDYGLDRIEPGAFKDTLRKIKRVPMLWQHFDNEPIGVWENMSEDRRGLAVTGQINLDTQRGREARSLVKQGAVQGLSIGYIPRDFEFEDEVRVLKRVDLLEVSLATFPMNPEARVVGVKHDTRKQLESRLRDDLGLSVRVAKHVAAVIRDQIGGSCEKHGSDRSDVALEAVKAAIQNITEGLKQ